MGGLIVIAAIVVYSLLLGKLSNIYMILLLVTIVLIGAFDFADDFIKTIRKKIDGLNGWLKIDGQVILGLIVGLPLRFSSAVMMNEVVSNRIVDNSVVVEKSPEINRTKPSSRL